MIVNQVNRWSRPMIDGDKNRRWEWSYAGLAYMLTKTPINTMNIQHARIHIQLRRLLKQVLGVDVSLESYAINRATITIHTSAIDNNVSKKIVI